MHQVAEWLAGIGLGRYAQIFADNGIDLDVLPDLREEDLEKLGVLLGHRRKLLRAIATLAVDRSASGEPVRPSEAERRQLTVMFCDMVGSMALSTRLDPEDMREIIRLYQDTCAGVVARYEGFVAKFMGDGVLVHFGYPLAHEDDAERAARAGLEIAVAVGRLKLPAIQPLQVRIGIATGLVVVGDLIGRESAQEQAVVGETPNLAARLQGLAPPGAVVVAASTRRLLGDFFRLRSLGRQEVKGLAEPVEAWLVEGISTAESRFEGVRARRLTAFVGREPEVGLLEERRRRAWQGEGQVVLISGEAGIGKSRFTARFAERIASETHARLRYQCSPHHTGSALYPFVEHLKRAARLETGDPLGTQLDKLEAMIDAATPGATLAAPLFAALLSIPFGDRYPPLGLSAAQQRHQTLTALLDHLEGIARRSPVLLLFEDAHWADATSLEVLDLAVERVRQLPVLVLVTHRPEFEPAWSGLDNVGTLALSRLDRPQAQAMLDWVTGGKRLPDEVVEQILDKTDGVPLFVEELTKMVLESGLLVEERGAYHLDGPLPPLAIPMTLQDSLVARLDRLAPVKEIAQIAAAIGREFTYALLQAVAGRDAATLDAALAQLEAAELVHRSSQAADLRYRFKHALVQDAAYSSLLRSRRQLLHRRIAEALRDRFPAVARAEPEVIAHHFTQSGDADPAVEWWSLAGEQALRRSAHVEAIASYRNAVAQAEGLPDEPAQRLRRLRLQIAYGQTLIAVHSHAAPVTAAAFARAWELVAEIEDVAERLSVYYGLWVGSHVRGELATARQLAQAFLDDAQRRPGSPEAGLAYRAVGMTAWAEGDLVRSRDFLARSLSTYDRERDRDLSFRLGLDPGVAVTTQLAVVQWQLGETAVAARLMDDAADLARESRHVPTVAYGHGWRCLYHGVRRDGAAALPDAQLLVELAGEHRLPLFLAIGSFFLAWARWRAGDRSAGTGGMREALAGFREQGLVLYLTFYPVLLAEAEAEAGDAAAAWTLLDEAQAHTERTGQRWFEAELHRQRGELFIRRRPADIAAAEAALVAALAVARRQQARSLELRAALALASLYRDSGRRQAAADLLAPLLAAAGGLEATELERARRLLEDVRPAASVGRNPAAQTRISRRG